MDIKKHYQSLLDKNGISPEALQYTSKSSQYKRFEVLLNIDNNIESLIDVGCGLGDMYQYLMTQNFQGNYLGLDFVEDFVRLSKDIYKNYSKADFQEFDITRDEIPSGVDFVLLSGVFNNKRNNNKEFMLNTIKKMFNSAEKGVAFNALSTYVDYQDEHLYYSNPLDVFDFCKKEITSKVVLKHDYLVKENSIPFEYTVYLYKECYS
jgi:SAM-dependent methyltransferase